MKNISKLNKRKLLLQEKLKSVKVVLQLCKEGMQSNTITFSQRQTVKQVLRPVLKNIEDGIKAVKCEINDEFKKEN